jgi:hypothetical protein
MLGFIDRKDTKRLNLADSSFLELSLKKPEALPLLACHCIPKVSLP